MYRAYVLSCVADLIKIHFRVLNSYNECDCHTYRLCICIWSTFLVNKHIKIILSALRRRSVIELTVVSN